MDTGSILAGLAEALSGYNLLFALLGALLGTLVGVLPGLGPATTMAVLLPITFNMPPSSAIIMLAGIFYGAMYGGSTTSILVRTPGEVASIITTLDGYEMAKQGRAGPALATAAVGSFIAGIFGTIVLILLAGPIVSLALRFGPAEYAAIIFFSLCTVGSVTGKSRLKGLTMAMFGLALGTIGVDTQTGADRLTFGNVRLNAGLDLIVFSIGIFAVSEVFQNAAQIWHSMELQIHRAERLWMNKEDLQRSTGPYARGTLLGFVCGVLPLGPAISTLLSYTLEKRVSKHPDEFGRGAIEGVAGPETANNAAVSGSLLPLFSLGLPTSVGTGIILMAFQQQGLQPGPLLFTSNPILVWTIIGSMFIGNFMLLVLNLPLVRIFSKVLEVPPSVLWPVVLALCTLGVYVVDYSSLDLLLMLGLGVLGYGMAKLDFPAAPLLLAMLLGDKFEISLRQGLSLSGGDATVFVTKPLSLLFILLGIGLVVLPPLWKPVSFRVRSLFGAASRAA